MAGASTIARVPSRARKRQNRAIIAAEVRRFGHVINMDGVFGTHRNSERKMESLLLAWMGGESDRTSRPARPETPRRY
jgi:hypothetical protein